MLFRSVAPSAHRKQQTPQEPPFVPDAPYDESDLPECLRGRMKFQSVRNMPPEKRKLFLRVKNLDAREDVALLLMPTPGRIPVKFYIEDEQRYLDAPRNLYVSDTFQQEQLIELLGAENVVYKG